MVDSPLPPRPQPPPPPQPQAEPSRTAHLPWLFAMLLALLAFLILPHMIERGMYAWTVGRERAEVDVARGQLPTPALTEISRQFTVVAKAIGPSVVHIDTVREVGRNELPLASYPQQAYGQGSGVIVDEAGYILTNNHVVAGAGQITVKLSGNETRPAEIVGLDDTTDLAVLKIPEGGLIAAEWGDSEALAEGSLVWAVGNPFGLDRSVTFGIISAKNRRGFNGTSPYQDFLQTDAAVNPGNSGGPLVDVAGKIVGINTAIVGRSYQGVSFSIPSSIAREVYNHLRESGKVVRGYLGVQLADLNDDLIELFDLDVTEGAVVAQVAPGTPAAQANFKDGDVIVEWDGHPVVDATELTLMVGQTEVGARVAVKIIRRGKPMTLDVTVGERPSNYTR